MCLRMRKVVWVDRLLYSKKTPNIYTYTPDKSVKFVKSNIQNSQITVMKTADGNYPLSG